MPLDAAIDTMMGAGYRITLLCHVTRHGFLTSSGRYRVSSSLFFSRIVSESELIADAEWWVEEFGASPRREE